MKRSIRILVLNNYPLDEVWHEVRRGEKPDHHLYGINHLERMGYEIKIVPTELSRGLCALARVMNALRNPIPLGALDRQWSAWRQLSEADLVFAPCGEELNVLAYLRASGLLRTPLMAIQHHALNRGRMAALREPWVRAIVRGVDVFAALNRRAAEDINRRCPVGRPKSAPLTWGPDASFYPRTDRPGSGALAAGRTGRDFVTFGRAASQTAVPAKILCLDSAVRPAFSTFAANVRVETPGKGHFYNYPQMMREHLDARVIAIPLDHSSDNLAGLTSLVDALALGKPVIMTRNPFIDLDIEAQGIGRWVAPGDVDAWAKAIAWFEMRPEDSLMMGRRARALVEEHGYNSQTFAAQVERHISSLAGGGPFRAQS